MSVLVGHKETLARIPSPLPPALLLTGPEGVGKSIAARVLAYSTGVSDNDYQRLDIRTKSEALDVAKHHAMYPLESDVKVSVIDITKASPEGTTALLSLLENPPEYSRFILHSNTDPFLTIKSRCFHLQFGYLTTEEVKTVLKSKRVPEHTIEDAARLSQGRVSVALRHAEGYGARSHVQKILKAVVSQDPTEVENALRHALEKQIREDPHEGEARRSTVAALLATSVRTSIADSNHPLTFVPVPVRLEALRVFESPARAVLRVRAGTWLLVEDD